MKKKTIFRILSTSFLMAVLVGFSMSSCKKKTSNPVAQEQKPETTVQYDHYPKSGHYVWTFHIGNLEQNSHLSIYTDSIGYMMLGPVYTNNYTMLKQSYSEKDGVNRWVGLGTKGESISKEGKYFVLFFKDVQDDKFTVFKKEFETKAEAETFPMPAPDETDSHGWNIYEKK